ncbi:hypothetical protein [Candidatus Ruminimicrobium bovinum]|uniref:hypothetical protein n=1 Tax=Candidatus Ruminimicrobium bovinum TaxID=3242779 RepID=UPI0039B8285E
MTSDELINLAFGSQQIYPLFELYIFQKDKYFLEYLQINYPSVYDFITSKQLTIKHLKDGIAAITINQTTGNVILFINYHKITYIRNICLGMETESFYETLACLIMHEQLHYMLKHFRVPFDGYNHKQLNIAQDMVIDNMIHRINPGWRNWQTVVDEINNTIDKLNKNTMFNKISTEENSKYDLLNFSDLDIYFYISELNLKNEQERIDKHEWNGDKVTEDSNGAEQEHCQNNDTENSQEKSKENDEKQDNSDKKDNNNEINKSVEDIFDKLASKARERIAQNTNRKIAKLNNNNSDLLDKVINKLQMVKNITFLIY